MRKLTNKEKLEVANCINESFRIRYSHCANAEACITVEPKGVALRAKSNRKSSHRSRS
jgi:hypothetical protein